MKTAAWSAAIWKILRVLPDYKVPVSVYNPLLFHPFQGSLQSLIELLSALANISQSIRGIYCACETGKYYHYLCLKCFCSREKLHPAHTMEQRGSEETVYLPLEEHDSEKGSSVAGEDTEEILTDLETVVATVQRPQSKIEEETFDVAVIVGMKILCLAYLSFIFSRSLI